MDGLNWEWASVRLKKYLPVAAVLILGLILMALPEKEEQPQPLALPQPNAESLEDALGQILSRLEGAGKVEVLLTEHYGRETVYQVDGNLEEGDRETVIITGEDRSRTGLVRQVNPPSYLGAVVLCQGGADDRVRLQIVQAVMSVTGLRSDRITVLKMK